VESEREEILMSLVACAVCRQPFYASCHDSSCIDATCPYCEYEDDDAVVADDEPDGAPSVSVVALITIAAMQQSAS
jgi:hypothetical protein